MSGRRAIADRTNTLAPTRRKTVKPAFRAPNRWPYNHQFSPQQRPVTAARRGGDRVHAERRWIVIAWAGAVPLLVLAVCPLSMLLMMRAMGSMGSRTSERETGDRDEVARLRAEVDARRADRVSE